jgi:glutamate formiminotransferase/formiminotetrahydrofolate cyclodeaminase
LAFNVNLRTADVTIAEAIARAIRHQTGGLRYVKALGVLDGGRAQVTINLTNPSVTPPHRVLALIRAEAERYGVGLAGSEVIGLAPLTSLLAAAEHHLQLSQSVRPQLLEWQLLERLGPAVEAAPTSDEDTTVALGRYLDVLASAAPTPGGGSAAALAGALAAALAAMVANLTIGRERFAAVETSMEHLLEELTQARQRLTAAMLEDAAAFAAYLAARRLPRGTAEERSIRQAALQAATLAATETPLDVARQAAALLPLCQAVAVDGNPSVASDAGVAALLAEAAVRSAGLNVRVNLPQLGDSARRAAIAAELAELETTATAAMATTVATVRAIIEPAD